MLVAARSAVDCSACRHCLVALQARFAPQYRVALRLGNLAACVSATAQVA